MLAIATPGRPSAIGPQHSVSPRPHRRPVWCRTTRGEIKKQTNLSNAEAQVVKTSSQQDVPKAAGAKVDVDPVPLQAEPGWDVLVAATRGA